MASTIRASSGGRSPLWVKSRISEGLKWWEDTLDAMPNVRDGLLKFTTDFTHADAPVHTGYEPITRTSQEFGNWVYDFLGSVGDAEEFGAAIFLGDLVHGAAHVDVDDGRAVVAGPACAVGHDVRIAAVELHADGFVEGVGLGEVEGGGGAAEEALGGEEIGAGEAEAAVLAADGAEGEIAVPGDGREEEVGVELDVGDAEHGEG